MPRCDELAALALRVPTERRFRATVESTSLDWRIAAGLSVRTYEVAAERVDRPCASAHHAELAIALTGRITMTFGPRREERVLRPGEALLVPRGTPHLWSADRGTELACFDIDLPIAGPALSASVRGGAVTTLARTLDRARAHVPLHTLREPLRDVIAAMGDLHTPEPAHDSMTMFRVLRYIDARYTEPLRLPEIATAHHLERHYLVRGFTRNFGVPPMTYIRGQRERRFLWSLMASRDRSLGLGSVATDAGIVDYPTFCRTFRRTWGKPPSRIVATSS